MEMKWEDIYQKLLIHPFTKLKLGYQLKYHIQVYNDKNVGIGFYLTNSDDYGEDIYRNLENCMQIQIHIDYSTVVGEKVMIFLIE